MKMRMQFVTFIFLHWLLIMSVHGQDYGTAIMIVRTNTEIAIATDSQLSDLNDRPIGTICKIRPFGNFFVVTNGMHRDPPTGFDAFALLETANSGEGSIYQKIARFEELAKPALALAFKNKEARHQKFGATFMGYSRRGTPIVISRRAIVTEKHDTVSVEFEKHACPGDICARPIFVPRDSAERFQLERRNYRREVPIKVVEAFIQFNLDTKQPAVGPPIVVLRLTRGMSRWIKPCPTDAIPRRARQ